MTLNSTSCRLCLTCFYVIYASDNLTRVTRGENPQVIPGCRGLPLPEGCELTSELLPERLASCDASPGFLESHFLVDS